MSPIDDLPTIRNIDTQNVLGSIESLPRQCLHSWEDASQVEIPKDYKNPRNIVMCGMGGSGLGARTIESVYAKDIPVPFLRVNDYALPGFVNQHSLVFVSSYSGSTEETLNNARQAVAKKLKWIAIGTGGPLIDLAMQHRAPFYRIIPRHNPSNQPRMAIGYTLVGQLVLTAKTGIIVISHDDIVAAVKAMETVQKTSTASVETPHNPAKTLAKKLLGKIIILVAAEHLIGAGHTVNNQINENAKTFSADFQIPELNHHLIEGLKHPPANSKNLFFVFADSTLYSQTTRSRLTITRKIVSRHKIQNHTLTMKTKSTLGQAFEFIQFGAYVGLYLSILYNQNPAPIPWVDFFKEELKRRSL